MPEINPAPITAASVETGGGWHTASPGVVSSLQFDEDMGAQELLREGDRKRWFEDRPTSPGDRVRYTRSIAPWRPRPGAVTYEHEITETPDEYVGLGPARRV